MKLYTLCTCVLCYYFGGMGWLISGFSPTGRVVGVCIGLLIAVFTIVLIEVENRSLSKIRVGKYELSNQEMQDIIREIDEYLTGNLDREFAQLDIDGRSK